MLEVDHLELQENNQEPITRPKLKRLILEYLQKRSRKEILLEDPRDEESGSPEQAINPFFWALKLQKISSNTEEYSFLWEMTNDWYY